MRPLAEQLPNRKNDMFDLEKAIRNWRQQMAAGGVNKGEALDELESHLRDDVQQQIRIGLAPEQAFETAVDRMGGARALKSEFAKISRPQLGFFGRLKAFLLGAHNVAMPPMTSFSAQAQQTLEFARAEAPRLNHDFIGTEHVLLGLLNSQSSLVTKVMRTIGVDTETVRKEIQLLIGPGLPAQRVAAQIPFTPRATRALALAVGEAEAMQQQQVSPEHIFLGLIKEGEGVAAIVLKKLGVDIGRTREELAKELRKPGG
jgi:hypothetical protein